MPGLDQPQAVKVALRRQSGLLFELAMQSAQREGKLLGQRLPTHLVGKVIFQPRHQEVKPRVVIGRCFHQAAFTQQHQQLHKQDLAICRRWCIHPLTERFHLPHQLSNLLQHPLIHPPVGGILPILFLR